MKSSPVQLLQLLFEKVAIELDERHASTEPPGVTPPFSFEGVTLKTTVGIAELERMGAAVHLFQVSFELFVENKKSKSKKPQRFCPYLLHLKAKCLVHVPVAAASLASVQDLALVNGAALIWSSMREQVAGVTSRMSAGQILLPTVHFQDLRSDYLPSSAESPETKSNPASAPFAQKPPAGP